MSLPRSAWPSFIQTLGGRCQQVDGYSLLPTRSNPASKQVTVYVPLSVLMPLTKKHLGRFKKVREGLLCTLKWCQPASLEEGKDVWGMDYFHQQGEGLPPQMASMLSTWMRSCSHSKQLYRVGILAKCRSQCNWISTFRLDGMLINDGFAQSESFFLFFLFWKKKKTERMASKRAHIFIIVIVALVHLDQQNAAKSNLLLQTVSGFLIPYCTRILSIKGL